MKSPIQQLADLLGDDAHLVFSLGSDAVFAFIAGKVEELQCHVRELKAANEKFGTERDALRYKSQEIAAERDKVRNELRSVRINQEAVTRERDGLIRAVDMNYVTAQHYRDLCDELHCQLKELKVQKSFTDDAELETLQKERDKWRYKAEKEKAIATLIWEQFQDMFEEDSSNE